jgi:serine/threonine protein kinase
VGKLVSFFRCSKPRVLQQQLWRGTLSFIHSCITQTSLDSRRYILIRVISHPHSCLGSSLSVRLSTAFSCTHNKFISCRSQILTLQHRAPGPSALGGAFAARVPAMMIDPCKLLCAFVNVLTDMQIFLSNNTLGIVHEYAAMGTVYDMLKNQGPFPESLARFFFQQLVCGVRYLHERGVAHREIRLKHLLVKSFNFTHNSARHQDHTLRCCQRRLHPWPRSCAEHITNTHTLHTLGQPLTHTWVKRSCSHCNCESPHPASTLHCALLQQCADPSFDA